MKNSFAFCACLQRTHGGTQPPHPLLRGMVWILYAFIGLNSAYAIPDKGMYPPLAIQKEILTKAGLRMDPNLVLSLSGKGLLPALVRVGGCSGSFVSAEGLLVTNHHCAFDAVAGISTPEQNHLEKGFYAHKLTDEIPAKGLSLRITVGFEDCSDKILGNLPSTGSPVERQKAIKEKMVKIEKAALAKDSSSTFEVSEMFPGKSYVLFQYTVLRDIRIVYAPSRAIGEFGGESDNWVWPRHTGDYTFLRAYAGPKGENRAYHPENIPFKPMAYLPIASKPLAENDFVMIMGYPGRTFRHYPASYIRYQAERLLPITQKNFDWLIERLEKQSEISIAESLLWSSRIKSLANTAKNYRGKIQGLRRVPIIPQFESVDLACRKAADPLSIIAINTLDSLYGAMHQRADLHLNFQHLAGQSKVMQWLIRQAELRDRRTTWANNPAKDSLLEAETKALNQWKANNLSSWRGPLEKDILQYFVSQNSSLLPQDIRLSKWNSWLDELNESKEFSEESKWTKTLGDYWYNLSTSIKQEQSEWNARLGANLPTYLDLRLQVLNQSFIPDANGTLRLTYGNVQGFSPEDGVFHRPFTTLNGMFEKAATNHPDYRLDSTLYRVLREGYNASAHPASAQVQEQRFGDLAIQMVDAASDQTQTIKKPRTRSEDIPVAFLYNLDTTGGNSGSPVMNADGELVGVNFDRAFGATINDFAWNADYSRSIGVDIRFVLWNLRYVVGDQRLLSEIFPLGLPDHLQR
ncbi:MAG: S46 family peptidase [Sphingomonadales bacterium]|nr:S46 family peptidase [Sphingomonadales bacterium]